MPSTKQRISRLLAVLPKVQHRDRRVLAICIVVAIVFWLILNLSRDYSINKEVVITYEPPPDRLLINTPSQMADLTIKGQGWNLLRESFRIPVINITVGLEENSDGYISKGDVARLVEQQLASSQLIIEQLSFSPVQLETVAKAARRVPVIAQTKLLYADGFQAIGAPELSPDSVTIYGIEEEIATINSWPTDTIYGDGFQSDFSLSAKLKTPEHENISLELEQVTLTQEVEAFTEKSLYVPVTVRNPPADSFRIFPQQVRLKVAVLQSEYSSIIPDSFLLVADLSNLNNRQQRNSIPLILEQQPQHIVSVQYTPRAAEFFLFKE